MKIKSIKNKHFKGDVYNLTMGNPFNEKDGDSYICNGIMVYNCIALDQTRWPLNSSISDHIAGMCIFELEVATLKELGFDETTVPLNRRQAFKSMTEPVPSMRSKFYRMPELEQRRIFGNDSLYNLWKSEQFPIESLVKKTNGMFVPKSFKEVVVELPKLGGISSPHATIGKQLTKLSKKDAQLFNKNLDPIDRATKNLIVVQNKDIPRNTAIASEFTSKGNGLGTGEIERTLLNPSLVARADSYVNFYPEGANIPWYDINEFYRILGVYTRKSINGRKYSAFTKSAYDRLLKTLKK